VYKLIGVELGDSLELSDAPRKALSLNGNQPHVMVMSSIVFCFALFTTSNYCYLYYNGKGNKDVLNKV